MGLHGLFPGYHEQIPDLISKTHLEVAQLLLLAGEPLVRDEVTRRRFCPGRGRRYGGSGSEAQDSTLVDASGSSLALSMEGPGHRREVPAEVVDMNRYANRNAFVPANGTPPLAASSGRTQRYRFNPVGSRRLNRRYTTMAITRIRPDTDGRA